MAVFRAALVATALSIGAATAAYAGSVAPAGALALARQAMPAALGPLTFVGYGFGHGRGMGQWGAYGYASVYHWGYQRILAHYYGGTRLARTTSPAAVVPVLLSELSGQALRAVAMPGQNLVVTMPGGGSVSAAAVEVSWKAGTAYLRTGTGCSGPWRRASPGGAAATTTTGVTATATAQFGAGAITVAPPGPLTVSRVEVCMPRSGVREYAGYIASKPDGNVFDVLPLEQYVDGVVPAESPVTWAARGGMAALEAQAVAARSYALAMVAAQGYVCDTTQCQVYRGVPDQYGPTADTAVAATAGQILLCLPASTCGPAGTVALAEYSASTGGYSAGGAFPAVTDQGDAVAGNPVHSWSVTVSARQLRKAFPSVGGVTAISVTSRNGLGAFGGRALLVTVTGPYGQIMVAGYRFAALLGLPSNWFTLSGAPGSGTPVPTTTVPATTVPATTPPATTVPTTTRPAGTVPTTTVPATTVPATTRPATTVPGNSFPTTTGPVGTSAGTAPSLSYWVVTAHGYLGAAGRAPMLGTALGTALQGGVAGMAAPRRAQGYWLAGKQGGVLAFGQARWYGSASGRHLRAPVVAMTPTPDGRGYWLLSRDGGVFAYGDAHFFGSVGADRPGHPVVAMAATPDGQGYWLVTGNGGVFPFGDAGFYGSPAGSALARPLVGIVPGPGGHGYFLVAEDGGVFAYGSAHYAGSLPAEGVRALVVAVSPAPHGGYLVLSAAGDVYEFSRGSAGMATPVSTVANEGDRLVAMALYRS